MPILTQTFFQRAVDALLGQQLVALPTETVYGLAGDATDDDVVARIFALKGRPSFNPLIIHVTGPAQAMLHVQWNELAEQLAAAFWPGALTFILPRATDCPISLLASAGLDTLAVRCPAHPLMQQVLAGLDFPLAAPSANRSGRISPTSAEHVEQEFAGTDLTILDGGDSAIGLESTVVDLTGDAPVIVRPGSVTLEQLQAIIPSTSVQGASGGAIISPGQLASHYAPSIPVRLNATQMRAGEALLAFGDIPFEAPAATLNLSETGDLVEAAANLFAYLRQLDSPEHRAIAVMPIAQMGIGLAINDRLSRAAAGR